MPTLHWIGKEKVINHHRDVPFRTLEHKYRYLSPTSSNLSNYSDVAPLLKGKGNAIVQKHDNESGNKIIHGDNLEALKALLPEYEGKVKCIAIDPPYNTGNENWIYNDNVNDPKIKKWLAQVVGKEGEDLSRHDKWLCMMYPRLQLLHKLMADDGVIFVHIDENAYTFLYMLMIEIFGTRNDLGTMIWDKRNPKGDSNKISYQHESIIIFSKNFDYVKGNLFRKKKNAEQILKKANQLYAQIGKKNIPEDLAKVVKKYKLPKDILEKNNRIVDLEFVNKEFKNWIKKQDFSGGEIMYNHIDENGKVFRLVSMAWPNKQKAPDEYFTPLVHPVTKKPCPIPERGWRYPIKTMSEMIANELVIFGDDESKQPERKYLLEENMHENIASIISFGGSDDSFQKEINIKFENPKPNLFTQELLSYFTDQNSIILDSFAGSGTTAHAVLNLNKEDGGNRKFILIEMEDYAETITAERVKRVISGYADVDGTGGEFDYYELGEPLFVENNLNPKLPVEKIREYIYFMETKLRLPATDKKDNKYLLGVENDTAYYFYYEPKKETALDYSFLKTIKTKTELYIVYADNCLLPPDFMQSKNIIFKKIPREIPRI